MNERELAKAALGIEWENVESAARRVCEYAAPRIADLERLLGLDRSSPVYGITLEQCETWALWREALAKQTKERIERNTGG